jgi:hypothetical protein
MKLTENYLRNMIKQVIKEMHDGDYGMSPMNPFKEDNPTSLGITKQHLSSLEDQGYKVREMGNGSYEIMHPTDSFKSYILEPKSGDPAHQARDVEKARKKYDDFIAAGKERDAKRKAMEREAMDQTSPAPSYQPPARPSDDEYSKFLAMRNRNG